MVSSAVYRYFASRDELLTALIIDAYNALGAEAESADAGLRVPTSRDGSGQWAGPSAAGASRTPTSTRSSTGARSLATSRPMTPSPPRRARRSSSPASSPTATRAPRRPRGRAPEALRTELERLGTQLGGDVPPPLLARGLTVWMGMFGAVSFELFGQLHNVVDERDALFEFELDRWIGLLELR